jgi:signal transduction histidine kinase
MAVSLRTKQVAGVTAVVALAVLVLSGWYVSSLTSVLLESSRANAQFLSHAIYQRLFAIVAQGGNPAEVMADDPGLRSILEAAAYSEWMEYASVVDPSGRILADTDLIRVGTLLVPRNSLDAVMDAGPAARLRALFADGARVLEVQEPLLIGGADLGTIRVGVSLPLVRQRLRAELVTPLVAAGAVLLASILVAILLARVVLLPIHVLRSGLARLGRGEVGVNVDLPADAELAELGDSFRQVSARLAADRTELAGQRALESVVERLEDAVALFSPDGALLFSNAAMDAMIGRAPQAGDGAPGPTSGERPALADLWPEGHPYRTAVERALAGQATEPPAPALVPGHGERLLLTQPVPDPAGSPFGVVLVSRNLAYLSQVESTLSYSRKLAALSRLTAGIAHEIKNPLNATMIHLELLRMRVANEPEALQHVGVIADQVRRLDEVVQGFMKFTRPEDLQLQPVDLVALFERLHPLLEAEAAKHAVELRVDLPPDLPWVEGDPNLLDQAFLNLALNACQAMPAGGRLRISAQPAPNRMVAIEVADTGAGIAPEHLSRIFDLYFTTKPAGSGIGLSLVFRTVQLHDGDIEVRSTPGAGTTFQVLLRQAVR